MSFRLGCEAADLFAAIAPVAGALAVPQDTCNPGRPVPMWQIPATIAWGYACGHHKCVVVNDLCRKRKTPHSYGIRTIAFNTSKTGWHDVTVASVDCHA